MIVPLNIPPVIVPVTLISAKLPVVALTVADWMVFVTLKLVRPARLLMLAVVALIVFASTVPVTLKLVNPVKFVMFALVAVRLPLTVAFVVDSVVRFVRLVILFAAL